MNDSCPDTTATRVYFLDWLRILAFVLLVFFHTGMYYVTWDWHVKSPLAGPQAEPFLMLSAPWRMSILFLISGAATAFMLARTVSVTWLRERAARLLLPLVLGVIAVVPAQAYFEVVQKHGYAGGFLDFLALYFTAHGGFCRPEGCLILPTWNHLWFLPYVFTYSLVLWSASRLAPGFLDEVAGRLTPALAGPRLLWLPALVLVVLRLTLGGAFPVTHALAGDWFAHAQYGLLFALGAALARSGALWPRFEQARWPALAVALGAWILALRGVPLPALGVLQGIAQWCAIVAALGFARRFLDRDSELRRALSQAVFPLYLFHQTFIILLAMALAPFGLPAAAEAALIATGTFALCFGAYRLALRSGPLRPLFGLSGIRKAPPEPARAELRLSGISRWG